MAGLSDTLEQVCTTFCLPRATFLFSKQWGSTSLNMEQCCTKPTVLYLFWCTYCTLLTVLYLLFCTYCIYCIVLYLLYLFVFSTWQYSKCYIIQYFCISQDKTRCQICPFWAKLWKAITRKPLVCLSWNFLWKYILTNFIWDLPERSWGSTSWSRACHEHASIRESTVNPCHTLMQKWQ
jgi:hypothetical protein